MSHGLIENNWVIGRVKERIPTYDIRRGVPLHSSVTSRGKHAPREARRLRIQSGTKDQFAAGLRSFEPGPAAAA